MCSIQSRWQTSVILKTFWPYPQISVFKYHARGKQCKESIDIHTLVSCGWNIVQDNCGSIYNVMGGFFPGTLNQMSLHELEVIWAQSEMVGCIKRGTDLCLCDECGVARVFLLWVKTLESLQQVVDSGINGKIEGVWKNKKGYLRNVWTHSSLDRCVRIFKFLFDRFGHTLHFPHMFRLTYPWS